MNVDILGERAARALRETAAQDTASLDTQSALERLRRVDRRRSAVRGVVLGTLVLVGAAIGGAQLSGASEHDRPDPAPFVDFPPLEDGYDVIASAVAPSGGAEAVATYREAQPAVVLVRTPGETTFDVVWSAPTPHELGDRNVPFPAAVGWKPDGSRIAILVGQERGPVDRRSDLVDLTLVTVNPDGTARQIVAEVGTCRCASTLPAPAWDADQVEIDIPDGPDQGPHTREMP